jgi:L-2,4-diaminobutyric acid acetyltransferase
MSRLILREPQENEGYKVHKLISECPPLDTNSMYCNLLQCAHFAKTSAIAVNQQNDALGFISGYIKPEQVDTLFIWQVAVSEAARGQGLAKSMLKHILSRSALSPVAYIETTITDDNPGSWALFESIAQALNAPLERSVYFAKDTHFNGTHDTENLVRIGPFDAASRAL